MLCSEIRANDSLVYGSYFKLENSKYNIYISIYNGLRKIGYDHKIPSGYILKVENKNYSIFHFIKKRAFDICY